MHYLVLPIAVILVLLGWWGIHDATTGTGQLSYAGTFLGLANMIAGIGLVIFGRIVQATHHHKEILEAMRVAMPAEQRAPQTAPPVAPPLPARGSARSYGWMLLGLVIIGAVLAVSMISFGGAGKDLLSTTPSTAPSTISPDSNQAYFPPGYTPSAYSR